MTQFLRIRNWGEFQHYKDRDPPWIKLHRNLLTSRTWVSLDDASRVLAVALMMLAAGTDNRIPADRAYLRRVAYLNCDPDWQPLIAVQFIELVDENGALWPDASTLLASDTKCSSEERREETEKSRAEERETRARDAPRGTTIDAGSGLTGGVSGAVSFVLDGWRRDVPECNPIAFAKWIVHVELSGRTMNPAMRLGQARRLAGNGDFDAQAEVVDFCCDNGYKTLIPIGDVRARTQGMARRNGAPAKPPWVPPITAEEAEERERAREAG